MVLMLSTERAQPNTLSLGVNPAPELDKSSPTMNDKIQDHLLSLLPQTSSTGRTHCSLGTCHSPDDLVRSETWEYVPFRDGIGQSFPALFLNLPCYIRLSEAEGNRPCSVSQLSQHALLPGNTVCVIRSSSQAGPVSSAACCNQFGCRIPGWDQGFCDRSTYRDV